MNSKYKEKELEIIKDYKDGCSYKSMCLKYGCSRSVISSILTRRKIPQNRLSRYEVVEDFFQKIDNEEKAYFLGLIYADGHNSTKTGKLTISLQKEDDHILKEFADLIVKSCDKPLYARNLSNRNPNWKDQTVFTITSKKISVDLNNLGVFHNKTLLAKFPIKFIPDALLRHFIRGLFDGDGYFYTPERKERRGECTFGITGTNDILVTIQEIFRKYLETPKKTFKHKFGSTCSSEKGVSKLLYSSVQECFEIYKFIYEGCNFRLDRKFQKMKNFFEKFQEKLIKRTSSIYKNVSYDKTRKKWIGIKLKDGKSTHKRFHEELDAYRFSLQQ